jgi:hypothetical protein
MACCCNAADLTITVAVVDTANMATPTRIAAEREAGRIIERAGIHVTWHDLASENRMDLESDAIVIRIVERANSANPNMLGEAFVPASDRATYATVSFDRVRHLVQDSVRNGAGTSVAAVLGHVIAHEIGHLLLGTNSHSKSGVMTAVWQVEELRSIAKRGFNFRPNEAAMMRAEVARRNSRNDPTVPIARAPR